MSKTDLNRLTITQIRQRLLLEKQLTQDIPSDWDEQKSLKAGVLIPFVRDLDSWHIVFIRRSDHEHDYHRGQVAFAGGKYEDQDRDLQQTALREAHEEIGLHPQHVEVLGQLNYHYSITRFKIAPVVAHVKQWPYAFVPDPDEVARVFSIPLSWLAEKANFRMEQRTINGRTFPVVFYDEYDGEVLWGATARMVQSLISCLRDSSA
jgi:8-oxo-dGTP pyrophosphatase MutT (NUDIX family)